MQSPRAQWLGERATSEVSTGHIFLQRALAASDLMGSRAGFGAARVIAIVSQGFS